MLSCYDVADYFLATNREDEGDLITNLKLQKLVYYAQGLHLALYGKPLYSEPIEAWAHGPVVPELYRKFKGYGTSSIPTPDSFCLEKYDEKTRDVLDEVSSVYGQFAAWKLANLAYAEPPYIQAGLGNIISHKSMRDYFRTQLVSEEEAA